MRIGILSYRSHPYSGGQGIYVKHLSKSLSDLGHKVSVLSGPPYPELDDSINQSKNFFELPLSIVSWKLSEKIDFIFENVSCVAPRELRPAQ